MYNKTENNGYYKEKSILSLARMPIISTIIAIFFVNCFLLVLYSSYLCIQKTYQINNLKSTVRSNENEILTLLANENDLKQELKQLSKTRNQLNSEINNLLTSIIILEPQNNREYKVLKNKKNIIFSLDKDYKKAISILRDISIKQELIERVKELEGRLSFLNQQIRIILIE